MPAHISHRVAIISRRGEKYGLANEDDRLSGLVEVLIDISRTWKNVVLIVSIILSALVLMVMGFYLVSRHARQKAHAAHQQVANYLKQERNFVNEILATIGSLVVVLDRKGSIVLFNQACQKTTGYSSREVLGRKVWDFLLTPDDIEPVKKVFSHLQAGDFPISFENYWLTKKGERRLLQWTNTALTDEEGKVNYIIATGVDVTEQRQVQKDLQRAHAQLEERVAQRTEELAATNLKLKAEIGGKVAYQEALQQSEQAIRKLYEITSEASQSFEQRVRDLLKLGCEHFDASIGILAQIKNDQYKVVEVLALEGEIEKGDVFPLGDTYCQNVLQADEPIGFEFAGESEWHTHPAYQKFRLESYLGAKIKLKGEVYGTLNFSSPKPREKAFSTADKEFLQLMANWVGEELLRQRAERKFRSLLESAPDSIVVINSEGRIVLVNQQAKRLFGYSRDELLGQSLDKIIPVPFRRSHKRYVNKYFGAPYIRTMSTTTELFALHKDGYQIPVEISLSPFETEDGLLVSSVIRDITARKEAERELRRAATVFENTNEGIAITDGNFKLVAVNRAFTNITGYTAADVLGKPISLLRQPELSLHLEDEIRAALASQGQWKGEIRNRRKDGASYPVLENISVVKDEKGRVINFISLFSDISNIKESEERLNYLAHHDALTNLPNRLLFSANLDHAIERAKRYQQKVALLFLDLDRFKIINDTLGHSYGDALLQTTARRLLQSVRREDTVARLGGDEFTIVMTEISNAGDAALLARKVIERIREPVTVDQQEIVTSTSIGISIYPDDAKDAETLVKAADTAMYHAKELGKDNFQFYTQALTDKAYLHLSVERGLRQALQNDELELFYQPQISLQSNEIVGMEALIRWRHPDKGLISPEVFIGVAEESGLINAIGEWVLTEVCRQIKQWCEDKLPRIRIAVNLSGKQILHEHAVHALEKILDEASNASQDMPLDLEITESVLQTAERSVANLKRLKAKGVRLAIDDFGTGYSSLSHIKHLPIDIIKIDRSFVRDISLDPDDEAIASAIIAMGHSLNLKVIGEGVESAEQLQFLRSQGCDEVQGFFFSEPVPASQVPDLFREDELVQEA